MNDTPGVPIGLTHAGSPLQILAHMANRHGLIAGATGTGKTVTLQKLCEGFSRLGIPVFAADIKGDLSGIARAGAGGPRVEERVRLLNIPYQPRACPTAFWDLLGKRGHPVRASISEVGPLLLGRLLDLNDTQSYVLQTAYRLADDQGLLLLDVKDLRAVLAWMSENSGELRAEYGNLTPASVGTIQRNLMTLEEAGGDRFFGEPALRMQDLMQRDFSGQGVVSILDATGVIADSRVYSTFLLWLLSELFENLPEVGDAPLPSLVFFFDEAHLLFRDTPRALVEKIEQVVRLIRSKGVGIFFVTQNPLDIPETVLGQLGHRVQHALRAFTPADQKAVKTAADTFRPNPALDTAAVITELAVGEALVSVLDPSGRPTPVERVWVAPPESRIGPLTDGERAELLSRSPFAGRYDQAEDRESAYEKLMQRRAAQSGAQPAPTPAPAPGPFGGTPSGPPWRDTPAPRPAPQRAPAAGGSRRQSVGEAVVKSLARSMASSLGTQIMRGVLGSILGRRR